MPTKSNKRRRLNPVPVYVVDLHDGAMLPFVDAVEKGDLPKSGVKMLHYDSHPDLGNIEKRSTHLYAAAQGNFNLKGIDSMTDIATWITPLVLSGTLDEVIWCAGHWCKQIKPGTYDLVCGMDKTDGKLKTADADGTNSSHAILNYWDCDGAMGKLENMNFQKRWKLHVVIYQKDGTLAPKDVKLIQSVIKGQPWVLDIDEDFFSCNNPYRDNFAACFGDRTFRLMQKIYEIGCGPDRSVKQILKQRLFMKSESEYLQHSHTKTVIEALNEENFPGVQLMKDFRKAFHDFYKKSKNPIKVNDLIDFDEMHETGQLSGLPHHISRVDEIARMGGSTQNLLKTLGRPVHVTLATSRTDRYLPDAQAAMIHFMTERMMEKVYKPVKIDRRDKPEFSVDA